MIHRNTFVNGPAVLDDTWEVRGQTGLFFAGQMSGVEGYVESAASGLLAGSNAAALVLGRRLAVPPRATAVGALAYYASHAEVCTYQPSNITFGIIQEPAVQADTAAGQESSVPGARPMRHKRMSRLERAASSLATLDAWILLRGEGASNVDVFAETRRRKDKF
jgi:methylenetetrahydrofolate--tRNA-(uracil-5-)-methyltransferase